MKVSGDLQKAMLMGLEKKEWNPPDFRDLEKQVDEILCS